MTRRRPPGYKHRSHNIRGHRNQTASPPWENMLVADVPVACTSDINRCGLRNCRLTFTIIMAISRRWSLCCCAPSPAKLSSYTYRYSIHTTPHRSANARNHCLRVKPLNQLWSFSSRRLRPSYVTRILRRFGSPRKRALARRLPL